MATLNLYEAKTQLSKLVDRAAAGEEIVIAKAGKPMVRLVPVERRRPRNFGFLKGKVWFSEDYDRADAEIEQMFEESEIFPSDVDDDRK